MEIDYSDKSEYTEDQLATWNRCQSLAQDLVKYAEYRASDEGVFSNVIDKGGDERSVVINQMLDALWRAEDENMDLVPLIHSMVLRITYSLGSDEQHNKMKELLRLLDEKYGDFP